ncbi:MAG: NYN domain-containing protein [Elusimicrobia bacterium]|nr:NYN domain-containing protein [Elusimicrobiota bacterium]
MPEEKKETFVAMFIDFENLRYSLLNLHGQEPDFGALVSKAMKYGRPSVMRAYADFSEHPPELRRRLDVAGIEAINVTVKRTTKPGPGGKPIERVKNAADMVLALDAVMQARDADKNGEKKIFLLVAGDRDYVKLVTLLRFQFGQRVIAIGVPGSMAADLVAATGEPQDPVEVPRVVAADPLEVRKMIVAMVHKGPAPLKYWTFKLIDSWAQDKRQAIPGTAKDKRDAIGQLEREGVLVKREQDVPNRGRLPVTHLDEATAKSLGYLP